MHDLPVIALSQLDFKLIQLFLNPLLAQVNALVHLHLGLQKHVADKLLHPLHQDLGLNLHAFIFLLDFFLFAFSDGLHILVLFANRVYEGFCVVFDTGDLIAVEIGSGIQ